MKMLKLIDNGAFENCEKLTTINLENIEEIRWNAFENAKSLKGNLVLKNVTTIEFKSFFRMFRHFKCRIFRTVTETGSV